MTSVARAQSHRLAAGAGVFAIVMGGFAAWLIACGPFLTDLDTVTAVRPANEIAFTRGEIGVVRPRLARRYLVHAYRMLSGLPAAQPAQSAAATPMPRTEPQWSPAQEWAALREQILTPARTTRPPTLTFSPDRQLPDTYQSFTNCGDAAFGNAVRTGRARIERFGPTSAEIRDWATAQDAVFRNCSEGTFVLPEPISASADPVLRADRAYQIAAAYFYAMDYEEAARRFRAIAEDAASPWRVYGRYLAARAAIRHATVPENAGTAATERLEAAERELKAVLTDPAAALLHRSAQDLLGFVAMRLHPMARLHEVSARLGTAPRIDDRDLEDFCWLMDRFVGDTVEYRYEDLERRADLIDGDDLTDWILAVQDGRSAAAPRALARWEATRSTAWLVAALWTLPPDHASVGAVLDAAQGIDRASPAFQTVAFLRVRLLAAAGRLDDARAALASLPDAPTQGFQAETVNLLQAERLMLARTLEEFLAAAPRTIVGARDVDGFASVPGPDTPQFDRPVFGEDAAATLNDRLPLNRLVDAAGIRSLPTHLRVRIAMVAFSRAALLRRDDAALAAAGVLRDLVPTIRADASRFINAPNAGDRHHAAVLLLLRTPGMRATLPLEEDNVTYSAVEPPRRFDHTFRNNWWCGFADRNTPDRRGTAGGDWIGLIYPEERVPFPAFVTDTERTKLDEELTAIAATGSARSYLTAEAIQWAQSRPSDPDAAEALALAVEGWRWSNCADGSDSPLPQRAFQTLHKLFPRSEWARRTKYWYR